MPSFRIWTANREFFTEDREENEENTDKRRERNANHVWGPMTRILEPDGREPKGCYRSDGKENGHRSLRNIEDEDDARGEQTELKI